jgi:hypothetical protein
MRAGMMTREDAGFEAPAGRRVSFCDEDPVGGTAPAPARNSASRHRKAPPR